MNAARRAAFIAVSACVGRGGYALLGCGGAFSRTAAVMRVLRVRWGFFSDRGGCALPCDALLLPFGASGVFEGVRLRLPERLRPGLALASGHLLSRTKGAHLAFLA